MRFQIRDLLFATTIVAVYAAGFSYLLRLGDEPLQPHQLAAIPIFVSSYGLAVLGVGWSGLRRLGGKRVGWRAPKWWVPHLIFLTIFSAWIAASAWRGGATTGIAFPAIMAAQHGIFLFNGWIVLGENGVMIGLMFVPWKDCRLRLDEETKQLLYSHKGQMWSPRFPLENQKLPVPTDKIDAVRELLAEKKPEAIASD